MFKMFCTIQYSKSKVLHYHKKNHLILIKIFLFVSYTEFKQECLFRTFWFLPKSKAY